MPNSYAENLVNSNEKEEFETEKPEKVKRNKRNTNLHFFYLKKF